MLKKEFYAYSMYKISNRTKEKAKALGVSVQPSKTTNKKVDVFKDGKKVASVGHSQYKDFHIYKREKGAKFAKKRQKAYRSRHAKNIKVKGSPGYYSNALLWT